MPDKAISGFGLTAKIEGEYFIISDTKTGKELLREKHDNWQVSLLNRRCRGNNKKNNDISKMTTIMENYDEYEELANYV